MEDMLQQYHHWLGSSTKLSGYSASSLQILQICPVCMRIQKYAGGFLLQFVMLKMSPQYLPYLAHLTQLWRHNHWQPPKSCKLLSCTVPEDQLGVILSSSCHIPNQWCLTTKRLPEARTFCSFINCYQIDPFNLNYDVNYQYSILPAWRP